MANANGIGFSKLVSIGNKADVDELDMIRALGDDPETKVIAGYLESITDGNAFVREAEQISDSKPILLMKSGGTARRRQGRLVAHRQPGRRRDGLRVRLRAGRDHPLRLDQAAVRLRPGLRQPAAARRARAWRSSPTPAARASWPPMPSSARD